MTLTPVRDHVALTCQFAPATPPLPPCLLDGSGQMDIVRLPPAPGCKWFQSEVLAAIAV